MDKRFIHMVPLMLFTILGIAASGLMIGIASLVFIDFHLSLADPYIFSLYFLWVSGLMGAGIFVSFFHLGRKERFLRAVFGVTHSWLSLEVFFAGILIVFSGLGYLSMQKINPGRSSDIIDIITDTAGVAAVLLTLAIGKVYDLSGRSTWKGIYNSAAPLITILLFGSYSFIFACEYKPVMWIFFIVWVFDFLFASIRAVKFRALTKNVHRFVFPRLKNLTGMGYILRIVLSLCLMIFSLLSFNAAGFWIIFLTIILDRLCFYAGMSEFSPRSEIAVLKEERGLL